VLFFYLRLGITKPAFDGREKPYMTVDKNYPSLTSGTKNLDDNIKGTNGTIDDRT